MLLDMVSGSVVTVLNRIVTTLMIFARDATIVILFLIRGFPILIFGVNVVELFSLARRHVIINIVIGDAAHRGRANPVLLR